MATILLLEDNHDMLSALSEVLQMHQYQVMTGYNGQDGLELLQNAPALPDLIITDINMPDMNGLEFLGEVRRRADWAKIPVAIMSGLVSDQQRALASGADAFVTKPFRFNELERTLSQLTNR